MTSLSLAVKMQSSKRILRSHEIPIPQSSTSNSATVTGSSNTGTNILSSLYPNIHNSSGSGIGSGGNPSYFWLRYQQLDRHEYFHRG
uniref:Uncharacterized protein n=1 Tax=Megaselia scalaris TaxID=36166 RepID=T1GRF3_MEGSC